MPSRPTSSQPAASKVDETCDTWVDFKDLAVYPEDISFNIEFFAPIGGQAYVEITGSYMVRFTRVVTCMSISCDGECISKSVGEEKGAVKQYFDTKNWLNDQVMSMQEWWYKEREYEYGKDVFDPGGLFSPFNEDGTPKEYSTEGDMQFGVGRMFYSYDYLVDRGFYSPPIGDENLVDEHGWIDSNLKYGHGGVRNGIFGKTWKQSKDGKYEVLPGMSAFDWFTGATTTVGMMDDIAFCHCKTSRIIPAPDWVSMSDDLVFD